MIEPHRPIRVVYFGTPGYAVPALQALAGDPRFVVPLVVTQPDRPAGRGRALHVPAVKAAAKNMGLPVYQPESLRTPESRMPLEVVCADLFLVAAYGLIFGKGTLAIPRFGCLNLHASVLPAYRGASPVAASILAGDPETGVTVMRMDTGMDTGDILAVARVPIGPKDTTASLTVALAEAGATVVGDTAARWIDGEAVAGPQPAYGASLVRPLVKSDGWIDWRAEALAIERQIRAMQPWPRTYTTLADGSVLQILGASVEVTTGSTPGRVLIGTRGVRVDCGEGALLLGTVQPAGSGPMTAKALANGRKIADGDVLGMREAPELPGPLVVPIVGSG